MIEKDIQFTTDVPSKGENSKMPVLDLAIWTEDNSIEYTFYRKKVSSIYTVMRKSAVTTCTKLDTVFQEFLRRLYNVSPRLPWQERASHLSKFYQTMLISGYNEEERFNTIKGANHAGVRI